MGGVEELDGEQTVGEDSSTSPGSRARTPSRGLPHRLCVSASSGSKTPECKRAGRVLEQAIEHFFFPTRHIVLTQSLPFSSDWSRDHRETVERPCSSPFQGTLEKHATARVKELIEKK